MHRHFHSKNLTTLILVALVVSVSDAQISTIHGRVIDAATRQPLTQAFVGLGELGHKTITNNEGRFTFERIGYGSYTLLVHHIAYANVERTIVVSSVANDSIIVSMWPALLQSEEVVVRSAHRASANNATPYPYIIASDDRLLRHANVSVSDALKSETGIALVRDGSWETDISIRGMSRSSIVTLIDNTRIETSQDIAGALSLISLDDLERAEIIKSPGSIPHGSGALGGVLHLVTKRPSFGDELSTRLEFTGRATSVDGGFAQHFSLENSAQQYALRISGGYRKAADTMTPEGILPNSQYSDFTLNTTLGLKPLLDHSLYCTYQRSQTDGAGIPGGSPIAGSAVATYTLARREMLAVEYSIPNLSPRLPMLTFRSSRQVIERNVEIVQSPALILTPHAKHTTTSFQVESKISPGSEFLLTIGAEAWQRNLDSRRERLNKSKNEITGERPIPLSSYLSGGLFVQNEWQSPMKNLTIAGGARYDVIQVKNSETLNPEYIITSDGLQTSPPDQRILWKAMALHNESWSANAGLTLLFNRQTEFTLLAATAFRSPSLEERFQFIDLGNVVRIGNPDLQPERSVSLNGGIRYHWGDLRIQADMFVNQLEDLVTEIPGSYEGRAAFIKTNIGKARLYGFELACEKLLTGWNAIRFSISGVRGEDIRNHTNLPQIAPVRGELESTSILKDVGTLSVSSSLSLIQNHPGPAEFETPGYIVFDVSFMSCPLNAGLVSLVIRAGIQNLFDTAYQNHLSTLRGILHAEPGRNYYLSAHFTL